MMTVIGSPWFSPAMRWTAVNAIEDDLGSPEPYAVDLAVEEVDQGGDRLRLVRSAPPRAPYWPPAFLAVAGRVAALALLKGLARPAMRQATDNRSVARSSAIVDCCAAIRRAVALERPILINFGFGPIT
jgi:hypothetical protein